MNKSLKTLVIDSATPHLFVALYEDNVELSSYYKEGHNDHSVKLMIELENIIDNQGLSIKDIDRIIVGIGPGSYTGLRVGVVVAKMFGWTLDVPVYSVSSLALLASSVDSGKVIPAVDARRGNAFLGLYECSDNILKLLEEEQLTNLETYNKEHELANTIFFGKPKLECIFNSSLLTKVDDIHQLTPNYLRITEAEKNVQKS